MHVDRRIAIIILLILALINFIFFFLLKPYTSFDLKHNHTEDNGEVIFVQDENHYSRDERIKPAEEVDNNETFYNQTDTMQTEEEVSVEEEEETNEEEETKPPDDPGEDDDPNNEAPPPPAPYID